MTHTRTATSTTSSLVQVCDIAAIAAIAHAAGAICCVDNRCGAQPALSHDGHLQPAAAADATPQCSKLYPV